MIFIRLIALTTTSNDILSGVGNPGADIVIAQTLRNYTTDFRIVGGAVGGITVRDTGREAWNLETVLDAAVITELQR